MTVPAWLVLNIYVASIAAMLLIISLRKMVRTQQDRSFAILLEVILVLLAADSLGRYEPSAVTRAGRAVTRFGTYITFACDPVGYYAASLYIDSWTTKSRKKYGSLFYRVVLAYVLLNFVLVSIDQLFSLKLFFYFQGSVYIRDRSL